jgi:hypothetical protein
VSEVGGVVEGLHLSLFGPWGLRGISGL